MYQKNIKIARNIQLLSRIAFLSLILVFFTACGSDDEAPHQYSPADYEGLGSLLLNLPAVLWDEMPGSAAEAFFYDKDNTLIYSESFDPRSKMLDGVDIILGCKRKNGKCVERFIPGGPNERVVIVTHTADHSVVQRGEILNIGILKDTTVISPNVAMSSFVPSPILPVDGTSIIDDGSAITISWEPVLNADAYKISVFRKGGRNPFSSNYTTTEALMNTVTKAEDTECAFSVPVEPAAPPLQGVWQLLPDTGQTSNYTQTFGEDCDYNPIPDGLTANPSYTKLDAEKNTFPEASEYVCEIRAYDKDDRLSQARSIAFSIVPTTILDNVTGLIWEGKESEDGLLNPDIPYSWSEIQYHINDLNADKYGGFGDWRLPTVKELCHLLNANNLDPATATDVFVNTASEYYWTQTPYAHEAGSYWCVNFKNGIVDEVSISEIDRPVHLRLVRGGQQFNGWDLSDNYDGTITDKATSLMWQKAVVPTRNWEGALNYCETLVLGGSEGYDDWRLPNRNELQSIMDYVSASHTTTFDNMPASDAVFWTSTTRRDSDSTSYKWVVDFDNGMIYGNYKGNQCYVLAVRTFQK